jgi:hypothetical protein
MENCPTPHFMMHDKSKNLTKLYQIILMKKYYQLKI